MISFDKSVKKILFRIRETRFFLFLMASISVLITSCEESSVIGLDVQPTHEILNVNFVDTATLFTKTVKVDSLRTDENLIQLVTNNVLLGTYIDPVFGKASASIYTQIALSTENPGFQTNPIIDSVVLSLVYDTSFYGKRDLKTQHIRVYQLSEDIKMGNNYYSNHTLSNTGIDIAADFAIAPKPQMIDSVFGVHVKPRLRVPLDPNFGQDILNLQGTAGLLNNAAFQSWMKGLYITTENSTLSSEEGNILRFNLSDSQSKITLFYHSNENDSLRYDLNIASLAHFSHFKHDHTTADASLVSQLGTTLSAANDVVFVQSMAGLKVKIEMPYLMAWNNIPSGINKAELVIKVNTGSIYKGDVYSVPAKLVVYGINDDGSDFVLPDEGEGSNYFGGSYNPNTSEYRINISRYIQQVLNGKIKNNGVHLLAVNGSLNANRVVLGGGGNGTGYQMKLNITSTKIP